MEKINAYIENIVYYNEENHYAVLEVSEKGEMLTAVGHFPYISAGETIEAEGEYTVHPVYGRQFSVSNFHAVRPEDAGSIERYLSGGAIKGIGPALAARIVKKFREDTFHIMEEEPERLSEIKGISEKMAMAIAQQMEEKRGLRDAVMFMQEYGISHNLANKIYERYGPALYAVIQKNPYQLADDIEGIGFKLADSIAMRSGLREDSDFRIKCGICYALQQAMQNGHTYLPKGELAVFAAELLNTSPEAVIPYLMDLQIENRIAICRNGQSHEKEALTGWVKEGEEAGLPNAETKGQDREPAFSEQEEAVYLASCYHMERNTAYMLEALNIHGKSEPGFVEQRLKKIQKKEAITLDEKQAEAVRASVEHGVLIITGGPGTGKTTTINTLIKFFEEDAGEIVLAAPTGRAAKRMSEATGYEAKTIHRLLEYTGMPGEQGRSNERPRFLRDEKNPIEADVVIVDEMSMVDIFLMEALLKAIVPGTRVIFVGDANQLPSVGAGNVLKDMIASKAFCTVQLTHIFRQAAMSDIVVNAHKINKGETVDLSRQSRDFLFIKGTEPRRITSYIETLITEKLPNYVGAKPLDIQVLTPTRKGALGVENLNRELQRFLNPPGRGKGEKENGDLTLRLGDKVMQIKNDYDLPWERRRRGIAIEKGCGIFNGDMGIVDEINPMTDTVTVLFDEERYVEYDHKHLQELELAYAVTVHKSQGSEYPAVVMPMYPGPHILMNKNLLYTAVTRARTCVCMVGLPQVFHEMEKNETENRRYSGLKERILELHALSDEKAGLTGDFETLEVEEAAQLFFDAPEGFPE